jgi:hypothetical protein
MTGKAEVGRLRQRLDATFGRAVGAQADLELLSDFARHLCVLVSGFLEQSVQELILEHVRNNASPKVQRYVESRIRSFTNANTQRLLDLLGSFDPDWRRDLEAYLVDARKDAVNSVIDLRNTISHGRYAGITMSRVGGYYDRVKEVVEHIAGLCDPA